MISAGYYVALWKGEPRMGNGLSVSDGLSHLTPDWWGLAWTTTSPGVDPVTEAARFGITADALPLAQASSADLYDKGEFRVHHAFGTSASAVEFCRRFVTAPARVLGLALPPEAASVLLTEYAEEYRDWLPGPYSWLKAGRSPDPAGQPRGFESAQ